MGVSMLVGKRFAMLLVLLVLLGLGLHIQQLAALWHLNSGMRYLVRAHPTPLLLAGPESTCHTVRNSAADSSRLASLSEAERHLDRALEAEPANPRIISRRAVVYFARSEQAHALALLSRVPSPNDHDPFMVYYKGVAQYLLGQEEEAIHTWRAVPGLDVYFARLGSEVFDDGCIAAAQSYWNIAESIDPSLDERRVKMYSDQCQLLATLSRPADALDWCHKALLASGNPWTHLSVGHLLLAQNQSDEVIAVARDLLRRPGLSPNQQQQVHRLLALAWVQKGEYGNALSEFAQIYEPNIWTTYELADLYFQMGNYDQARILFLKAMQMDESGSLSQRAQAYLDMIDQALAGQ